MLFISVRVFEKTVPETNRHPTDHFVGLTFSFVTIYKESLDHLSYYQLLRRQCTMNASRHSLRHLTWMSHQAIHRGRKLISWVEPWCTDHEQTFVWFTSFVHCDLPSEVIFIACYEIYGRSWWPRGQGVGLRQLGYWGRELEFRSGHECLSVVLSFVGRSLCDGLITRPEESYLVYNCVCEIKKPRKEPYVPVGNYRKMNERNLRWTVQNPICQVVCNRLFLKLFSDAVSATEISSIDLSRSS
jgi:hypothetical protein